MKLINSLIVTFKNLISKKFTIEYPEKEIKKPYRARWKHVLQRYEDGTERCIACMLCASICPTDAIYIEGDENKDEKFSHGERYARIFEIDYGRCIFCGFCIEACPTEALVMTEFSELIFPSRERMVFKKDELLLPKEIVSKAGWLGFYRKGDIKGTSKIDFKPYGYPLYRL